jgi:hypothetical protein
MVTYSYIWIAYGNIRITYDNIQGVFTKFVLQSACYIQIMYRTHTATSSTQRNLQLHIVHTATYSTHTTYITCDNC